MRLSPHARLPLAARANGIEHNVIKGPHSDPMPLTSSPLAPRWKHLPLDPVLELARTHGKIRHRGRDPVLPGKRGIAGFAVECLEIADITRMVGVAVHETLLDHRS